MWASVGCRDGCSCWLDALPAVAVSCGAVSDSAIGGSRWMLLVLLLLWVVVVELVMTVCFAVECFWWL